MEVRFETISGEGFMTFHDSFVLPLFMFDAQALFIQGENKDEPLAESNGSGKSNLLEVLTFTLFGRLSKRLKYLDDIINHDCQECRGEVVFRVGEERYQIIRTRNRNKQNTLFIYKNGNVDAELPDADNTTKQIYLESILGLNFLSYSHTVMFSQKFTAFPDLKAPQRASVLSEISGANIYLKAALAAKKRADEIADELAALTTKRHGVERLIQEIEAVDYDAAIASFETSKRLKLKQKCKATAGARYALFQHQKTRAEQTQLSEQKLTEMGKGLDRLDKQLTNFDGLKQQNSTMERQLTLTQNSVRNLSQRIRDKEQEIERTKNTQVGNCPYCGQNLTEDTIEVHIKELHMELNMMKRELASLTTIQGGEQQKLKEIKSQVSELTEQEISRTNLERAIAAETEKLKSLVSQETENHLKEALQARMKELDAERKVTHDFDSLKKQQQTRVDAQRKTLEGINKTITQKQDGFVYYQWWADNYPKLRIMLFDENVNRFEELCYTYLSRYSSELSIQINTERETQSGNLRDEINIIINTPSGPVGYEAYGGGEIQKIKMAMSLALSQLISEKSGKEYNLIAFDEPNVGLDRVGKDANAQMFLDLANEGKTVLVIEHDDYFRDYIPTTITVVKENHKSVIQGLD